MAQAILKLTHQEAVIKVWPSVGDGPNSNTIQLADLITAGQELDTENDQVVNIVGVSWFGEPEEVITITRGYETIMSLNCNSLSSLDMAGQSLPPDIVENTEDIVVTFTGTSQLYIKLRKVGGYLNQVETATYGAYDDPTRVGASTTLSGSPDRV